MKDIGRLWEEIITCLTPTTRVKFILVSALLMVNLGACETKEDSSFNIIMISLDTLRSDRLGSYGNSRPTSPTMDALANRGVRFAKTIAESSWTLPSHMTIMTGMYPTSHGVTTHSSKLPLTIPTLAQKLQTKGYKTYGYTAGGFVGKHWGFDRGFEIYDEKEKSLPETLSIAENKINSLSSDDKFFLFLHTYDVHCPYDPPEKYSKMFKTRPIKDHINTKGLCGNPDYNRMSLNKGQVQFISDKYDASIRAADDALATFFKFLETRDLVKNTIIVILSDHGEEFMEHGQIGHERTLYAESLMVPLIIAAPGFKGVVVDSQVGLADVAPTLLDLVGITPGDMQGRSLVPLMSGSSHSWTETPIYSELDREVKLRSSIFESQHFIVNLQTNKRVLFNLSNDPLEQIDLASKKRAENQRLTGSTLNHFMSLPKLKANTDEKLRAKQIKRLRSLGYVQ